MKKTINIIAFLIFYNLIFAQNCPSNLNLNASLLYSGEFQSINNLFCSSLVQNNFNVSLKAANYIELQNNFEVEATANFEAKIENCDNGNGFCFEDPLNEQFLDLYVNGFGINTFEIYEATDDFGNCWYRIGVNYNCSVPISDSGLNFFDSNGNYICNFFSFPIYPPQPNTCLNSYNFNPLYLSWNLISSCQ